MAIKRLPSTGDQPRNTGVPASLVPGGSADSAGYPWQGRTFTHHETAFAADDGSAPPNLRAALRQLRRAADNYQATADQPHIDLLGAARQALLKELAVSRLLVPLITVAGDVGVTPEGRTVEKTQELSIVTVAAPDGRRAMPVFTAVATMRAWNAVARPIPVPAPQAALAAAQEGADLLIVDPGDEQWQFGVRRTEMQGVALAAPQLPAWADPLVREAFLRAAAGETRVNALALLPGDPHGTMHGADTEVQLLLQPGLSQQELSDVIAGLQRRWAGEAVIAERVDSLRCVPRAA